ncbi:MAG: GNAT family N-acetyltransferase [Burkholderiaceae bacterium]
MTLIEKESRIESTGVRSQLTMTPGVMNGPNEVDSPVVVPIRSLGESYRGEIAMHLLQLDRHDRYLRFGFVATDAHIDRYIATLDFDRDELLGITNRKLALIAMAHLALIPANGNLSCAEFGVSVLKPARGRGFGALLFERAAMDARNKRVSQLFIHALSENTAMLRIARNAGAVVERMGSDSEAFLTLAPPTLGSRMAEIVEDHYAQIDYRWKSQSKQLHDILAAIKPMNRSERDTKSNPDN